jgi:hypothetical protein
VVRGQCEDKQAVNSRDQEGGKKVSKKESNVVELKPDDDVDRAASGTIEDVKSLIADDEDPDEAISHEIVIRLKVYTKWPKGQFVIFKPGFSFPIYYMDDDSEIDGFKVLSKAAYIEAADFAKKRRAYLGQTRFGKFFVLLARLPDGGYFDDFGQTMLDTIARGQNGEWCQLKAKRGETDYTVRVLNPEVAKKITPRPWPDYTVDQVLKLAVKEGNRIIDPNDPFIQRKLGNA